MRSQIFLVFLLSTMNLLDVISSSGLIDDDDYTNVTKQNQTKLEILSRRKRYVVFPVGSSFSCAVCTTVGIYGNPQYSMFSWGLNWGFAYELPTNSSYFHLKDNKEKRSVYETKPMMKRRYRRDLFNKLEVIMNEMGYNGQECILRALCESPKVFGKRGKHLVAELIRTIFTFPKSKVLLFEHPQLKIYDKAYRRGKRDTAEECHNAYPKCGFSLIKLALGKYSMSTLKSFM